MTTVTEKRNRYVEHFDNFEPVMNGGPGEKWLRPIRKKAIDRFAELGFPTKKLEAWKFTNVEPIADTEFVSPPEGTSGVEASDLEPYRLPGESVRLVFVNGHYVPGLSSLDDLPKGVKAGNLGQALAVDAGLVESHLTRYADFENEAFTALNTAFMLEGGFVYVPRGTVVEKTVHLLFVSTQSGDAMIVHPRNLIVAEEGSQVAVVEEYVSLGGGVHFSNVVTELVAGDDATVSHYVVERESEEAFNVGTLRMQLGRATNVSSHSVLLGGGLVRNNVHPVMAGEGGYCMINGLFMPRGTQHMDNYMLVEHASPHCDSRQFYNGILEDKGRGVFSGLILVHKDAQKTDAKQTNRNLLLSKDAQVDTKPQLEIYADDVKCTHGATIGQIDPDAIFYLRARGIPEEQAQRMLLFAFAGENLERMREEPIRSYVESLVDERLPTGADLLNR